MKITLVGPVYPFRGGIAHYTTLLGQEVQAKHNLQMISFKRQYPAWLYPGQSDRDPSSHPLKVQAETILDPLNPLTWRATSQAIKAFNPECVVIMWWTTFWAPAFAYLARQMASQNIPVIYLVHNVLPHEARPWDRWLARLALQPGVGFIVQTNRENERLKTLLPKVASSVCPHPVYDMFASQHIPQAKARARLSLPTGATVILFFGIVRPYKGLRDLLEAFGKLQVQDDHLHLLIAGEIWGDPSVYQDRIESLGLVQKVTVDNRYIPNEEVPLFFSAADLFVAPYNAGTASGATKLALGFGLPAVVTRNIVDKTLQNHTDRDVFIAEPGNPDDLAHVVRHALEEIKAGRIQAVQDNRTGWDQLVAAIENITSQGIPGEQPAPVRRES